ncbi:MAG: hypothetical protein ACREOI_24175 [bacterium]
MPGFALLAFSVWAASGRITFAQEAPAAKPDTVKLSKSASDSSALLQQSQLEKELEAALSAEKKSTSSSPAQTSPQTSTSAGRPSSSLNPAISVIGTLLGTAANADAFEKNINLGLQEAEFSFQAYVDPYAKADFYIAFGRHGGNPLVAEAEEGHGGFEPALEEAYLSTLALPYALKVKAGVFRSAFGKLNLSHPHAHPFADAPRAYANFLGDEGLADTGVSINWLVPNPFGYFQELTFEFISGNTESPSFAKAIGNKFLYLGHLKNFFDLTENATLEVGLTGVVGPNDSTGQITKLGGVDLTYKWKPLQRNRYRSFTLMAEALFNQRNEIGGNTVKSKGIYGFANYQIAKRWFLGGRYDYSEFPETGDRHDEMFSGVLAFYTSEFQKLEWQLSRIEPADEKSYMQILLRGVFVIGAHGAHEY